MKQGAVNFINLFGGDGIMALSKLVKAAVDHFYRLLWTFPGLWINQILRMQQLLHG